MDVCPRVQLTAGLHELVNEVVVRFASPPWLAQTEIEIIVKQFMIICANIKANWQDSVWVDAGAERIDDQLGDTNEDLG